MSGSDVSPPLQNKGVVGPLTPLAQVQPEAGLQRGPLTPLAQVQPEAGLQRGPLTPLAQYFKTKSFSTSTADPNEKRLSDLSMTPAQSMSIEKKLRAMVNRQVERNRPKQVPFVYGPIRRSRKPVRYNPSLQEDTPQTIENKCKYFLMQWLKWVESHEDAEDVNVDMLYGLATEWTGDPAFVNQQSDSLLNQPTAGSPTSPLDQEGSEAGPVHPDLLKLKTPPPPPPVQVEPEARSHGRPLVGFVQKEQDEDSHEENEDGGYEESEGPSYYTKDDPSETKFVRVHSDDDEDSAHSSEAPEYTLADDTEVMQRKNEESEEDDDLLPESDDDLFKDTEEQPISDVE